MTSLNPVFTIGNQIMEAIRLHQGLDKARRPADGRSRCSSWWASPPRPSAWTTTPTSSRGGMRQRAMIAMALSCRPKLLIADEPTTALDVTIQAQILDLIKQLKEEIGMAVMMITHDLGVIARDGRRRRRGLRRQGGRVRRCRHDLRTPGTPLHAGALPLHPAPDGHEETAGSRRSSGPSPTRSSSRSGCRFHPRCRHAQDFCRTDEPQTGRNRRPATRCAASCTSPDRGYALSRRGGRRGEAHRCVDVAQPGQALPDPRGDSLA